MQDYEYYQANAQTVNLEDITSDEENAYILASIRDNAPDMTSFAINNVHDCDGDFVVREGDNLGWLVYFVGRSEKLKKIDIIDVPDNINLDAFLEGLGRNRSIGKLEIWCDLGGSFQRLMPFLRNNNSLHELKFNGFGVGLQCARNIALLLRQQSSLKRLTFDGQDFDDDGFVEIAAALTSQPQIEELCVHSGSFSADSNGYKALVNASKSCPSLRKFELRLYGKVIEGEGLAAQGNNHVIIAPVAGRANMVAPNNPFKKAYFFFGLLAMIGAATYSLRGKPLPQLVETMAMASLLNFVSADSSYLTRTILKIKQLEDERERKISQLQDIVEHRERKITQLEEEREREISQLQVIVEQREREITRLGDERERKISQLEDIVEDRERKITQLEHEREREISQLKVIVEQVKGRSLSLETNVRGRFLSFTKISRPSQLEKEIRILRRIVRTPLDHWKLVDDE